MKHLLSKISRKRIKPLSHLCSLILILLLSSCGYHFRNQEERPTLSIHYVTGDIEGQLTDALIKSITRSGSYQYVRANGDFLLQVHITSSSSTPIGYEYSPNNINLFAIENRNAITAHVQLLDGATLEPLYEPFSVTANIEFDYANVDAVSALAVPTPSGKLEPLIRYSLGQFDSIEGSQEDATLAIYRVLAQKITSALTTQS